VTIATPIGIVRFTICTASAAPGSWATAPWELVGEQSRQSSGVL
jgi:hypothetical protein